MTEAEMTPFLLMYRLHPDAVQAGEFLEWLSHTPHLVVSNTAQPMAAAVLALAEKHEPEAAGWRQKYPEMFEAAEVIRDTAAQDRPGWNDYHGVRFGILGRREDVVALHEVSKLKNLRGRTAIWLMSQFLDRFDPDKAMRAILTELGWFKTEPGSIYAKGIRA